MELYMYFNENLVDSLCLDEDRISQPGYIGEKKRYLLKLHKDMADGITEPLFYVQEKVRTTAEWMTEYCCQ